MIEYTNRFDRMNVSAAGELELSQQRLQQSLEKIDPAQREALQLAEAEGLAPRLVEGRGDNLKVTRPEDLALAGFYLSAAIA